MDHRIILRKLRRLIRRYGTSDPFAIAKARHIEVVFEPLGSLMGYHYFERRCHVIVINSDLDDATARYVCAHELGHAILHPDINVSFSIPGTCPKTAHYEWEADTFAVKLLSYGLELYDGITAQQAAALCGIPPERAKWLLKE